jgi:hypothetical protein
MSGERRDRTGTNLPALSYKHINSMVAYLSL